MLFSAWKYGEKIKNDQDHWNVNFINGCCICHFQGQSLEFFPAFNGAMHLCWDAL